MVSHAGEQSPTMRSSTQFTIKVFGHDFKNFDGVRLVYQRGPTVVIRLKEAINTNDRLCMQFFKFRVTFTRKGKSYEDVVGCQINGLG